MKKRFKYEITPVPGHPLKECGYLYEENLQHAWDHAREIASAMAPMARVEAVEEVSMKLPHEGGE